MPYAFNRGLGQAPAGCACQDITDFIASCGGGNANCNPLDSECVATNAAIVAYAENIQEASFSNNPSCGQCIPADQQCGFTMAQAQAAFSPSSLAVPGSSIPGANQSGAPVATPGLWSTVVSPQGNVEYIWSDGSITTSSTYGQGVVQGPGPLTTQYVTPPSTPISSPIVPATPVTIQTTPGGSAIVNSSGASGAASSTPASTTETLSTTASTNWFTESMFDSIPNWALLAAAALGLWVLMGSGGSHGR